MQELGNLVKGGQEPMKSVKRTILIASVAAFLLATASAPQMAQQAAAGSGISAQAGKATAGPPRVVVLGDLPQITPQPGKAPTAIPNRFPLI